MGLEAWVSLAGVVALVLGALAGLTKAIADLISAWRKPDRTPAPELGIAAVAEHDPDDIDIRAYTDAIARAETAEAWARYWMRRAAGENPEPPTDPGRPGSSS